MSSEVIIKILNILALPVSAVIVLMAMLKILRVVSTVNSLLLYYGKQIEEIRRIVSSSRGAPKAPDEATDSARGMFEILMEAEGEGEKGKARPRKK